MKKKTKVKNFEEFLKAVEGMKQGEAIVFDEAVVKNRKKDI